MTNRTANRLGRHTNLLHGWIYFAPDATEAYRGVGLADEQAYFASRSAPMGAVGPGVVTATFFNFRPELVAAAVPSAWDVAAPETIQQARLDAAGAVLHRVVDDVDPADFDAATIEGLNATAEAMCAGVGYEGRPLAAANRDVPIPDDPLVALWQRITVLREWRGDAHVAVLTAAPLDAVEALALHVGTGEIPEQTMRGTRGWTDDEWAAGRSRLEERGLVTADGTLTDAGTAYRNDLEDRTDICCAPMVDAVGEDAVHEFLDGLTPLRKGLMASGVFPF